MYPQFFSVTELNMSDIYKDAVIIKIALSDNSLITFGNIYRSPNSTKESDDNLFLWLNEVIVNTNKGIILVGDVNLPDIELDIYYGNTNASKMFINLLQKNLLK
jgi:hypothetical protein